MPVSNIFNWNTASANYSSQVLEMNQRKYLKNQHMGPVNIPTDLQIVLNKNRCNQQHPKHRILTHDPCIETTAQQPFLYIWTKVVQHNLLEYQYLHLKCTLCG